MASLRKRNLRTLQHDLDALTADVSKLATVASVDPSRAEARNRIRRLRADLRKVASNIGSDSRATVVDMADNLIEPVAVSLSGRPITTIALGFGLGFIFGLAWRK